LRENMGVAFLQQNDIDHAIEQFKLGLAADPENVQLHYDLGLGFKLKDDLAAAIPELEHAEQLDPQLPDPPYTLGVVRMQQGRFAEAQTQLERAVALRSSNGEAWALLGSVYKSNGQPTKAAEALRRAIALQPEQPSPHIILASILTENGEREAAIAERKIAADLSRKAVSRQRSQFAFNSGRALLARGDIDGALVQFQAAVAAEPDRADGHLAYADVLLRAGRKSEAIAERQKAEALNRLGAPR
jgi:tetratricopeptide (TPR) repeat protein